MLLVTGGAGFIGSNFVLSTIRETGEPIVNLDKLTYGGTSAASSRAAMHATTSCKAISATASSCARCTSTNRVQSCISRPKATSIAPSPGRPPSSRRTSSAPSRSWKKRVATVRTCACTCPRTRFTARSARRIRRSLRRRLTRRIARTRPRAASDHLVRAYRHTYGLPTLTTNCSNNYGPYQYPEKLIPLLDRERAGGKPLPVYGDGKNVRDWLFVEDHCAAVRLVLERGRIGETYNIGGNCRRANIDVVKTICALLDEMRLRKEAATPSSSASSPTGRATTGALRRRRARCARARLAAARELRIRAAQDGALVSR